MAAAPVMRMASSCSPIAGHASSFSTYPAVAPSASSSAFVSGRCMAVRSTTKKANDTASIGSCMWSNSLQFEGGKAGDAAVFKGKPARFDGKPRAQVSEATPEENVEVGSKAIHGRCFVVGDNIDTDQIIPAEYLTLVPSKPEEYEKLGSYAMIGLPARWGRFIEEGKMKTEYKVVIGGANFGCGSSREHAPVALGAAGVRAVVAESYARIFFRNSVATGELYPVESEGRLCEENRTGDYVTVDLEHDVMVNHTTGKQYTLKAIGEAGPVINAGGIFAYARSTGMIASPA